MRTIEDANALLIELLAFANVLLTAVNSIIKTVTPASPCFKLSSSISDMLFTDETSSLMAIASSIIPNIPRIAFLDSSLELANILLTAVSSTIKTVTPPKPCTRRFGFISEMLFTDETSSLMAIASSIIPNIPRIAFLDSSLELANILLTAVSSTIKTVTPVRPRPNPSQSIALSALTEADNSNNAELKPINETIVPILLKASIKALFILVVSFEC